MDDVRELQSDVGLEAKLYITAKRRHTLPNIQSQLFVDARPSDSGIVSCGEVRTPRRHREVRPGAAVVLNAVSFGCLGFDDAQIRIIPNCGIRLGILGAM